jgi:hypothetical protein
MSSIYLTHADRNALLDHYRLSANPEVRLRAHILLLLGKCQYIPNTHVGAK